jgi:hypothetical protein
VFKPEYSSECASTSAASTAVGSQSGVASKTAVILRISWAVRSKMNGISSVPSPGCELLGVVAGMPIYTPRIGATGTGRDQAYRPL